MLRCEAFNPLKFMLIIDFKQELKVREEKNHQMCEWRPTSTPPRQRGGEGGRKTAADVIEGFAQGARARGGENSNPPLSPFS